MGTGSSGSLPGLAVRSGLCSLLLLNIAGAADLRDADWKRLNTGDVVVDSEEQGGRGRVVAMVLIDRDVEAIWRVILDCDRAPEFVPNMRRCEVLERAPDESWEIIEHEIKYSWFTPKTIYRFKAEYTPFERVHFERIDGDLRELVGDWVLTPLRDRGRPVLVSYSVFIDPGAVVPEFLVRRALRRDLPELMRALRDRVSETPPTDPGEQR